jgi:hypothetical protein
MKRKCSSCGLVCFTTDNVCKRCGSDKIIDAESEFAIMSEYSKSDHSLPFWSYLLCIFVAIIIEIMALFPVISNIGWRHSSRAPLSDYEIQSQISAFAFHLPTVLVPWLLSKLSEDFSVLYLLIPFTQIIFWTIIISFLLKWIKTVFQNRP